MERKRLPAEGLKAIACLSMLLDHVGAVFFRGLGLRVLGRVAFPIYCFQLVEGSRHTKNPGKYALRLFLILILSEIPFDFAFYGRVTWYHQNVLLTLLLGFGMLQLQKRIPAMLGKLAVSVPFILAAELTRCDYGAQGILMILLFSLAEELDWSLPKTALAMALVCLSKASAPVVLLGLPVPIELFALFALIPIACYSGKKAGTGPAVQWLFYFFYPVHLGVLILIRQLLFR